MSETFATDYAALIEADRDARLRALDAAQSFLVQAPAGSGKTELLVQRYLALLAGVVQPERIVAMTFTRKAAAEMRERIVAALRAARAGGAVASAHERHTRQLALAALAQDERQQWRLIEQPARLQVTTIDAFCARLLRQVPLLSRWGAMPAFDEFAQPRYEAAVREALHDADAEAQPFWRCVLDALGNDADRLLRTMSALLAKRDQWLPVFGGASFSGRLADQRQRLEAVLRTEVDGELTQIHGVLHEALREAAPLMAYAAAHLGESDIELAQTLEICAARGGLPPPEAEALDDWRRLAGWLLTQSGDWRKLMKAPQGFLPKSKARGEEAVVRAARKEAVETWLASLSDSGAAALDRVRNLPPPVYSDDEWHFIDALLYLLPRLLARFQLMCAADGAIDFTEAQLAAIAALGDEETPSDLLLALDMRIEHLLIDEFQDTSQTQMTLLRKLTAGWQQGDGRTLFAVGDPMQSIYRFRQAEVGLFLEAQAARRINDVPVIPLMLTRNFRSQARLVEWSNAVFPAVFAHDQDALRGAVVFKPSAPTRPVAAMGATVRVLRDAGEEGAFVAAQTAAALAAGARDVAILVRKRTDLQAILPALREHAIAFTAIRLDRLGDRPVILDLLMLTRTLVQPADELAWLSVLRAPWCGLSLADLTALARARTIDGKAVEENVSHENLLQENADESDGAGSDRRRPCKPRLRGWDELLLAAPENVAGLSEDGRRRLSRMLHCWRAATASPARLSQRTYDCWMALHGASCVTERIDRLAAVRFFECLDAFETAGTIADWSLLLRHIGEAFLPEDVIDAEEESVRVKVMTLHQAKGLQFDTVIIPGLGGCAQRQEKPLLRWRQRPQGILLAPYRSRSAGAAPNLERYLAFLEEEETRHELARLLYVGVTRAEQRLILTASLREKEGQGEESAAVQWKTPVKGSAMALWWETLNAHGMIAPPEDDVVEKTATPSPVENRASGVPLRRLPAVWLTENDAPLPRERSSAQAAPLIYDEAQYSARHVGTVVHRWLSTVGVPGGRQWREWTPEFLRKQRGNITHELAELGVSKTQSDAAVERVIAALKAVAEDPFAQWLLDDAREEARNEWALSAHGGYARDDGLRVRLDRTFIHEGVRWIVDYKTGDAGDSDVERWLDAEAEQYRPQLQRYADLMRLLETRPLKLVLYYPLLRRRREIG